MDNIREFTELLKGCRPHKDDNGNIIVQKIMNMSIVTLTTDDEYSLDDRFENPMKVINASNSNYGEITLKNNSNKETITPTQFAVITKQSAQNHGMVKAGYISSNSSVRFDDAGCVQGSTTGHFRGSQEFRLMPVTMREMLFQKVGNTSGYQNIYPAIRQLGQDTNSSTGEYLDKYFNKYDKKLEQFIAHFERPEKLIGTIVMIDDEIVAIDKFPSFSYAEQVWDLLIRDCYGALAIISELKGKKGTKLFSEIYQSLNTNFADIEESTIDRICRALEKTKDRMTKTVEEKIENLLDLSFNLEIDSIGNPSHISNSPKSYLLQHEGYLGQLITENNYHHMVSLVKKDSFDPKALRDINELRKKARNQDKFKL